MVLKEETADVVSFRESADGEQMPRVQAHGSGPRRERGTCVNGWEEASQVNATSRLTGTRASDPECDVVIIAVNAEQSEVEYLDGRCGGGSDGYT